MTNNWQHYTLGDVANVISGYAFKSGVFQSEGIPVIKIKNIRNGYTDMSDAACVSEAYSSIDERYHVRLGDILISLTGSHLSQPDSVVGRIAKHTDKRGEALLNQRAGKIIIERTDLCEKAFIFYLLTRSGVGQEIAMMSNGAASQANVSPTQVKSLGIFLPPLPIQQRVASILSAYDNLIENNSRRIKILEEMAQRIYKQWFVDFKFPGHEKTKFIDSTIGRIPEGWKVVELGERITFKKGKNITKDTIIQGNVPVVAAGVSPAYYHNKSNVKSPTVTISASGANAGFIRLYHEDIWASDCSYINQDSTESIFYFYTLLINRHEEITALQRGSAQPHVYPKDIMKLLIVASPEKLMIQFEDMAKTIFNEIKNLTYQTANLRRTRDLLLPKLINGEIEV